MSNTQVPQGIRTRSNAGLYEIVILNFIAHVRLKCLMDTANTASLMIRAGLVVSPTKILAPFVVPCNVLHDMYLQCPAIILINHKHWYKIRQLQIDQHRIFFGALYQRLL